MSTRVTTVFLAVLFLAGESTSATLEKTIRFEKPSYRQTAQGTVIEIPGCRTIGHPGEPMIPVYAASFILPPGETVSGVTVEAGETVNLADPLDIAPMPRQYALGRGHQATAPRPGERSVPVYESSSLYPASSGELVSEQKISGCALAFVNIYPCRVVPSSGTVTFASSVRITIETRPAPDRASYRTPGRAGSLVLPSALSVQNPGAASAYGPNDAAPGPQTSGLPQIPYIIITSSSLAPSFQPLAALKTQEGLAAAIVTTDSISALYSGADIQEKIRNFIADYRQNRQTEYVLLGGDVEIIPHRSLYVKAGSEIEPDIASDLYYAALDGNWNGDGDAYYGEPGEEDLIPEVVLGRLPVSNADEVDNFYNKLLVYSISPPEGVPATALMLGELLWDIEGEITWGGDYKDEIIYGSSEYGFTTAAIDGSIGISTLYDRDIGFTWNATHVLPLLNAGVNIVNHLGHGGLHNIMRIATWDVPSLTNAGTGEMPFVLYSQGCFAGAFDNRDNAGAYFVDDAIGEQLVNGPAGAVAFIGNTRLGWDSPGSTCGVSQFFDRQFFDALFGEGITEIGRAFDDSRIDNIPFVDYAAVLYVMYEMCLLGDPAMHVWTDTPTYLAVTHDSIIAIGNNSFVVGVADIDGPLEGARVSLYGDDPYFYLSRYTDPSGAVSLETCLDSKRDLLLSVQAGNHYLYNATISVDSLSKARPELIYFAVDDDTVGASWGDGDGIIESGETIELDIAVKNTGTAVARDTRVNLSCPGEYISVTTSSRPIGDIPVRAVIILEKAFLFEVDGSIPDGYCLNLAFNITTIDNQWNSYHSLTVNAPGLIMNSFSIADTLNGNGNGCIDSWEFENLHSTWSNMGSIDILSPVLTIECPEGGWVKPITVAEELPDIPAGSTVSSEGRLVFFVRETTPPFSDLTVFLTLSGKNIDPHTELITLKSCGSGLSDEVLIEEPWDHSSIIGVDGWHLSGQDYHSAPSSWKCGSTNGGLYPNMMEAVLVTPPLCLYENSVFSFWHKMEAEAGETYPYWASDASVVEISTDGGKTWTIINPSGTYPCRASSSNTIFLSAYQRCYSGSIGWTMETFDLSGWHGPVLLRFHFASDEQYGFEGWYIDDIELTTEHVTGEDPPAASYVNALKPAYPNPFNPSTRIAYETASRSRVSLAIYDVTGRPVRILVDEVQESGGHSVIWDGRDSRGRTAASGVYFCRLKTGIYSVSRRLVLLR